MPFRRLGEPWPSLGGRGLGTALGGGVFSPLSLSPVLWVAADKLTGLNNNDLVSSYTDFSGNANHLTQGTAANKPIYKTNQINGLPAVQGDGVDSFVSKSFTLNQPCTIFTVFKLPTESTTQSGIFDGTTINRIKFSETSIAADTFRLFSGIGLSLNHPGVASFAIATFRINGASSRITIGSASASGNPGSNDPGGITLYANGAGAGAEGSDVIIPEFIVYSGAMSDPNMNLVGAYLGTKYNLTWTPF